jgi:mRNA-degrading endonuclease RelE of RelBE toxin-antitoxin system
MRARVRRMLTQKGTRCLVNEWGEPQAVVIDLKKPNNLWLDVQDILIARNRRREPRTIISDAAWQSKDKVRWQTPRVVICRSAERELSSLTATGSARVKEAIRKLGSRAWPSQQSQQNGRRLVPGDFTYRLRVTAFHVVYEVYLEGDYLLVFIAHVRHRSQCYLELLNLPRLGELP